MSNKFGLKIGIEGEKEFKNALRDINQSFKVLGSEMNLVTSQFDKQEKSIQSITSRNIDNLYQLCLNKIGFIFKIEEMDIMQQLKKEESSGIVTSNLKSLYITGGIAALLAGILFRRNIAVEIGIFNHNPTPVTVEDWFTLLQNNRLLGLAYLHIFDVVNYILLGLVFLALYAVLKQVNKGLMAIATTLGFVGITVYFASNTALSMLSLSSQYAQATSGAQKNLLLTAGQSMLAVNRFTGPGGHPGSGGFISLLFVAAAGAIISLIMMRSNVFGRVTAVIGLVAGSLDLVYCILYAFVPAVNSEILAVCLIPAAGLLLMVWHIMIGWRLCKLWKQSGK